MDYNTIGDLVSNFGFPIVLSFVLLYYIFKSKNDNAEQIKTIQEMFGDKIKEMQLIYDKRIEETQNKCDEQIDRLSDSLDRNTEVMNKLLDKIKGE